MTNEMTKDVDSMTMDEMRRDLEGMGLEIGGNKAALKERLRTALTKSGAGSASGVDGKHADGHANQTAKDERKKRKIKNKDEETHDEEDEYEEDEDDGDEVNVDALSLNELQTRLRNLGLKATGNKATLRIRLKEALKKDDNEEESESDDDDTEEEDVEMRRRTSGTRGQSGRRHQTFDSPATRHLRRQPIFTFKDVEDALETFSGDNGENARRWIENFEETAEMCSWSEAQKIIYAKRLLRGSAKVFVNFEIKAVKWKKFKKSIIDEFSKTLNSKQVHRKLALAKKKQDETYQAYIYRMLEMASHADIELDAKIQYIIDGVPDDEVNKSVLYGATTIAELRKRFQYYETQRNNSTRSKMIKGQPSNKFKHPGQTQVSEKSKRCYNCGNKDHLSTDCPDKAKGTKCFKCGNFGHVSTKCANANKEKTVDGTKTKVRVDAIKSGDKKTYKSVTICGEKVTAIIDSGSDLHLIRLGLYKRLNAPELDQLSVPFDGVGSINNQTLGRFKADVIIDGLVFTFAFDVIPDELVGHDLIIGGELSDHAEIKLKKRQMTLTRIGETNDEHSGSNQSEVEYADSNWSEVLKIDVEEKEEKGRASDVTIKHVTDPEVKDELRQLIEDYQPAANKSTGVEMRIVLKDDIPVYQNPRRLSVEQRNTVNSVIDDWMKGGIVRMSTSDYASPIVLVTKKNGEPRLCVDYRMLNKKIIRDRFPLPLIEDQLDRLQDSAVFSTLDLQNGFFHVPVEEESIKYTSFVVPDGQYEFLKVPFGLSNSPAVFQRHIRTIFRQLITDGTVLVYLDDLIVPARNEKENLEKLKKVLTTAMEFGLEINWRKCEFLVRHVEYLGYVIEAGRIQPSDRKIQAVAKFPRPTTMRQLQSFLGLTSYFRKFVPRFALIARPLTQLLRGDNKFEFGSTQEVAFEQLKRALTETPVLSLYRTGAETELHTDACMRGLGAILMQKHSEDRMFHPTYYASWKTTPTEEKYTSYELEILAVIKALKKFRIYLLGIPFKIVTDCKAFAMTMKKKDTCLRVAHWALLIEEFQYTIEHRSGTSMRHVDALSRSPVEVLSTDGKQDGLAEKIHRAQQDDPEVKEIIESLANGNDGKFSLSTQGILYRTSGGIEQLVVPTSMQGQVIQQAHERGHFGWKKTEYVICQEFWFPRMRPKIQRFIGNCIKCILAEKKQGKAEGLLNPIEKGDTPLHTYHIDHLGPMPSTKKSYNHLFAVVDAFTKFLWLYPTRSTTTEEVLTRLRRQSVIFGNPTRIVTDRGTAFTSAAFKNYCEEEGIGHVLITTGLPRGNGQIERMNRIIIPILTKLSMPKPLEWYKHVEAVQQHINSTYSRSIKRTPFELMIGRPMKLKTDIRLRELIEAEGIISFEKQRIELRDEAKQNLLKIQQENRRVFNKRRKEATSYRVGDLVAIKRTQFGPGLKVHTPFLGPYEVTKLLRNDRYIIRKIGDHEGPNHTSTGADHMKPWSTWQDDESGTYSDELSDDDDPPDDKKKSRSTEDDTHCRMAECGIGPIERAGKEKRARRLASGRSPIVFGTQDDRGEREEGENM